MLSSQSDFSPESNSYPVYYHPQQKIYYHSPSSSISSPLPSPQILTHYSYPVMDNYASSPHVQLSLSPSPPTSAISTMNHSNSSIRFEVYLEAPTAASQKVDEPPLTYLNKGQYYNIILKDDKGYDGDIISTVSITFHDESHRVSATDYWKFWLTQQKDSDEARAIELDLTRSSGAQAVEGRMFDRVSFKWNGRMGASVHVRFNCLSTDFSRIKGVKGIPLRLQIESEQPPSDQDIRFSQFFVEKTYCRIKLFRDKGAERKNKDDAKHIERQLEKLRGKNGEPHPLWLAYSPTLPITLFKEIVPPEEDDIQPSYHSVLDNRSLLQQQSHMVSPSSSALLLPPPPLPSIGPPSMKRSYSSFSASQAEYSNYQPGSSSLALDIDPSYVPQRRRRIAKLSLLVKFESSEIYRAVYLEHLTLKEFTDKIGQRMEIRKPISNVYRKTMAKDKKPIVVKVDDEVIQDLNEEQDIHIETEDNPEKEGTVNLILNF